nr:class I SAM-dependent methyltransferase [uncultured Dongia sp.]
MLALPLPDASCDYVLAWNVIYHGDRDVVRQCLDEIRRVLKPGGIYQGTMLSKRNGRYGKGEEVAPNTFVIHEESDKAHAHFYCNAAELVDLYQGFELQSLIDRPHQKPGSYHWHLVADRL